MKRLFVIIAILNNVLQGECRKPIKQILNNNDDGIVYFMEDRPKKNVYNHNNRSDQKYEQVKPITAENDEYEQEIQSSSTNTFQRVENVNREVLTKPSILSVSQVPTKLVPVDRLLNYPTNVGPAPQRNSNEDRITDQGTKIKSQEFNISAAIGNFGINMMKNVLQFEPTNLVMSPYSVTTLLALLEQGASGETLEQIARALQMTPDVAATAFKQFSDDVKTRDIQNNVLNIANSVFVSNAISLNSYFESKAKYNFGSDVFSANFFESAKTTQSINSWVSKKTNNKISQLLSPDAVNGDTQLVMVNAMYFKGIWQMKFRAEATLPKEFNINNYPRKTIPFMRARRYYKCGVDKTNQLQVVILPFENQQYSMMVLLPPRQSSVDGILSNLTYDQLAEYHNFKPLDIELELPKFSVRSDTDLQPLLNQMGVTNIFGNRAELYGIGYNSNFSPQVSSALHTAVLSIDEEGSTAAAATSFSVVALSYDSPDAVFTADRPFLAVLWDTKLAVPLFMAKIVDPTF